MQRVIRVPFPALRELARGPGCAKMAGMSDVATGQAVESMAKRQSATPPDWLGRSRGTLLMDAIIGGGPVLGRIRRAVAIPLNLFRPGRMRRLLARLKELGYIDRIPSLPQFIVTGRDQIILSLGEETKIFYRDQNIPWIFHNVRRFLAEPSSMMDPLGLLSERDTIVHHVLQTFHRHPVYDLVLLRAFDNGPEELKRQLDLLMENRHPQGRALRSLIEDGSYHERLVRQVDEFLKDPFVECEPLPAGLLPDPHLMLAMDQFKDIRGYTNYANRLNVGWAGVLKALCEVTWNHTLGSLFGIQVGPKHLKVECCDPDLVAKYFPAA